jgi:hypothetical protein
VWAVDLQEVVLERNGLRGHIPASLTALPYLRVLNLRRSEHVTIVRAGTHTSHHTCAAVGRDLWSASD